MNVQNPNLGQQAANAPQQESGKQKRRVKNFLLQPLIQVKLGFYSIVLAFLFCIAIGGILYFHLSKFMSIVLELTDVQEEVSDLLHIYMSGAWLWLGLAMVVFLFINILVSVIFTHKLVGPTYAFRRHLQNLAQGRYDTRTYLRKNDAFKEVAMELNRLSEVLEEQAKQKR